MLADERLRTEGNDCHDLLVPAREPFKSGGLMLGDVDAADAMTAGTGDE
jgi:hypothetical protein